MYPFKRDRDAALAGLHEGPRVCDGRGKGGDEVENAGGRCKCDQSCNITLQLIVKLQAVFAILMKVAIIICNFQ